MEVQRHLRELNIYKMIFIHGPSLRKNIATIVPAPYHNQKIIIVQGYGFRK